jgi:hypothetical protein
MTFTIDASQMEPAAWSPPTVARLGEGLQDRHGRDAGASAFGHEHRQGRQRREVADLVQRHQGGRIESGAGGGCGEVASGLNEVLDECRHEGPRGASTCSGGEEIERAVVGQELPRVEVLACSGGDGVEDARIGEA